MATLHAQRSMWRNELVPNIVDHLAHETPDALYAEYPISPQSYNEGYRKITYRDLANAVNGAAQWISETLGPSRNHEVLTYIGPNDIRYIVLVLAAVKAGYVLFLTSPRNSVAAHVRLFERLHCTKLLSPAPHPPAVRAILDAYHIQHVAAPSISELLDREHAHYVYEKKLETARSEPFMIIHSSGSTGFPKPLVYTNETAARNISMLAQEPPQGVRSMDRLVQGKRVLNCFPPFHGACLVSHLFAAIPFGTVMIAPLAEAISTAQGVADALHKTSADLAFLVPSIVLELSQDDSLLEYCSRKLERCLYAGGDLPQAVGNKVAAKLPLVCQYGASEIGLTPQLLPEEMEPDDWKYVYFHPCLGIEFQEITDGNFELCVRFDPLKEREQPTFTLFPDSKEYGSRDLFKPHPKLPNLWSWCARADDIIVFLNGEKTNPISMEQHIVAQNPRVLTAIVIGAQRFQAALLLEPATNVSLQSTADEADFIEEIWPSIQEANKLAPAHARIDKALVLPMSKDKPVIRAGKGTIQRVATLNQYTAEIEKLYQNAEMDSAEALAEAVGGPEIQGIEAISQAVSKTISEAMEKSELDERANFFEVGLDSLQALNITRKLRRNLRMIDIAVTTVYKNPTISQLSKAIHELQMNRSASRTQEEHHRTKRITETLERFQYRVRNINQPKIAKERAQKRTVMLTGSTGTLGTYLVSALMDNPAIDHVYCLDRRHGAREIQLRYRETVGLPTGRIDGKVTFVKGDLAQPHLGLSEIEYNTIRREATEIVHNAWPVNFNLPLDAFLPQLEGLLNLFALCGLSTFPLRLYFVSSISSVWGYRTASGTTPEKVIRAIEAPFGNGYAESKFISEVLCEEASHHLGLSVSVLRVGQVAGPLRQKGLWSPAEWAPSLILSSLCVGALPDSLGSSMDAVDWTPVDLLAETIVGAVTQLALSDCPGDVAPSRSTNGEAEVLHLRNPTTTTWSALLPIVVSKVEALTSKRLNVLPSGPWLARVRQSVEQSSEGADAEELASILKRNPAIKLMDYFVETMGDTAGKNQLAQERTMARCPGLQAVEGVNQTWMDKWIAEWLTS